MQFTLKILLMREDAAYYFSYNGVIPLNICFLYLVSEQNATKRAAGTAAFKGKGNILVRCSYLTKVAAMC